MGLPIVGFFKKISRGVAPGYINFAPLGLFGSYLSYFFSQKVCSLLEYKKNKVKDLLKDYPDIVISNQVLNEISNVLLKKYKIDNNRVEKHLQKLLNIVELYLLDDNNTFDALALVNQYNLL